MGVGDRYQWEEGTKICGVATISKVGDRYPSVRGQISVEVGTYMISVEEGTNNGGNWDRCQWEEETDILGRGQISVEKVVKCQWVRRKIGRGNRYQLEEGTYQ